MIETRLKEYWWSVKEYRQASNQHKTGILNGRIPNTIRHTTNPYSKKYLTIFLENEAEKSKKATG